MKKIKKISALLAAAMISAGTVSSLSAGAIDTSYTKEEMDEILKDAYMLPYNPDATGWYKYQRKFLIETATDNVFGYYSIDGVRPDYISARLEPDVDVDALTAAMKEICPDADVVGISDVAHVGFLNSDGITDFRDVSVKGMDMSNERYLPYNDVRKKDVTYEQALKIYDLLNETGKLMSFSYTQERVHYSHNGTHWTNYLCDYDTKGDGTSKSIEKVQNYIAENKLDWTIEIPDYYEPGDLYAEFIVKPGKRMTAEEIVKMDKQLKEDLGIRPAGIVIPTMDGGVGDPITIDMHNNIKGDANDDGELRLSDAILILQSIGNPDEYQLTAQGRYNADIYGDRDGITTMDAVTVQRKILGLE